MITPNPDEFPDAEQRVAFAAGAYILAFEGWFNAEPEWVGHHKILRDNAHDGLERAVTDWLALKKEPK